MNYNFKINDIEVCRIRYNPIILTLDHDDNAFSVLKYV